MLARQRVLPFDGADVAAPAAPTTAPDATAPTTPPRAARRAAFRRPAPPPAVCQDLFAWAESRATPRNSRPPVRLGLKRPSASTASTALDARTPGGSGAAGTTARVEAPRDYGGPDPGVPCVGCPKSARCKSPCDLLAAALPPEETDHRREVRSSVLSEPGRQDGGHDEPFISIPLEWLDETANIHSREGTTGRWEAFMVAHGGERLRELIESPLVLTREQRTVIGQMLLGRERTDIRTARLTSRQSVHKVVHAALDALGLAFIVDTWREILASVGRAAVDEALDDADVVAFAAEHIARAGRARSGESRPRVDSAPVWAGDDERVAHARTRELMQMAVARLTRKSVYRVCGTTKVMRRTIFAMVAALEDYFGRGGDGAAEG
jgi:hypothetical protein